MTPRVEVEEDLKPPDVARRIGVTEQCLANWRSRGYGPPYRKLSEGRTGRIRYSRQDLERWLAERERRPGAGR